MLKKNLNHALEKIDENNFYTIIDDNVIVVNNTAFEIYMLCDDCSQDTVIEKFVIANQKKDNADVLELRQDVTNIIIQLLDLNLIVESET